MRKLILMLFVLTLMTNQLQGQRRSYNYADLSQDEIEELRNRPNPCAELKSQREAAIKQTLLNKAIMLDGNQADYDIRYYGIDISIDFPTESIAGHVDYQIVSLIEGLAAIDLNLHDQLIVDGVQVNGQNAAFTHYNHMLSITAPESFSASEEFDLRVYYHGVPVSGYGYTDGGMGFMVHGGYNICWTATEPFASRNWWPCKDYPSDKADSLDLYIECPDQYDVAAAGLLISEEPMPNNRKRVHWSHKYPIVTYLVAITCADFQIDSKTWEYDGHTMPVLSYTLPNAYQSREVFDTLTIPMLNHYSDAFGIYPFVNEKLANANCGVYGTMEHQTCSFHDPFAYYYDNVYLLIHENGHQWWGDMITCETFNHIWLNEGITTWTEAIFYEYQFGSQAYHDWMQTKKFFGEGTIYVENVYTDVIFDGNLSYNKGSWVMHMLRGVLGDSVFFEAVHDWYGSASQYGTATTEDFTDVISASVGEDLSWFVNQWIYGEGYPKYEYSWICEPDTGGGYRLTCVIEQVQTMGGLFTMPIQTVLQTGSGQIDTTLFNNQSLQVYSFWVPDAVTGVALDPQEWILRTVDEEPFEMQIATVELPDGQFGVPYWQRLTAAGGQPPYYWTFLGGDLPWGLTFTGDTLGVVSGTPTYMATFYFNIELQDSDTPPNVTTRSLGLTITTPQVLRGDADGDGNVNITDAVFLIAYIFGSGPAPDPEELGDADCNTLINISDAVYLIAYIFGGGPPPGC